MHSWSPYPKRVKRTYRHYYGRYELFCRYEHKPRNYLSRLIYKLELQYFQVYRKLMISNTNELRAKEDKLNRLIGNLKEVFKSITGKYYGSQNN
jgi:hypothetical protein